MKTAVLLLLLYPAAHAATCPTEQPKNESALLQIEHTWAQASDKHNTATLDCILASDFEEAGADGQLIDRSKMLKQANVQQDVPQDVHYELAEMHAHVYGDVAYVRGMGVPVGDGAKTKAKTRFTDIFVYREGRWQCVAGHESLFPAAHP
jgi:ketosteroid isomerase-like protein